MADKSLIITLAFALLSAGCDESRPTQESASHSEEGFGTLPFFELTDQDGKTFSSKDMRGRVSIVNFVFTRCDTLCPALTDRMKWIYDKTKDSKDPLLVSFSVDPEHDTPEKLKRYMADRSLPETRWKFVTGNTKIVTELVEKGFLLALEKRGESPSGVPNINHSNRFVLIDKDLIIRGFYSSDETPELHRLISKARQTK